MDIATGFGDFFTSMILPWCVLATAFAAFYARLLRANMLETMSEDYIRTARAKGLPERRVIYRHGLRSAITPVVTAPRPLIARPRAQPCSRRRHQRTTMLDWESVKARNTPSV